jgi:hypothetical protein
MAERNQRPAGNSDTFDNRSPEPILRLGFSLTVDAEQNGRAFAVAMDVS